MLVIDKIENDLFNNFCDKIISTEIGWFYQPYSVDGLNEYNIINSNIRIDDSLYYKHTLFKILQDGYQISSYYRESYTILNSIMMRNNLIQFYKPFRIKLNTTLPSDNNTIATPHFDIDDDNYVSVLIYLNNSSGNTVFFNQKYDTIYNNILTIENEVVPEKGKYLIFKSGQYHANFYPQKGRRIIMNAILEKIKN